MDAHRRNLLTVSACAAVGGMLGAAQNPAQAADGGGVIIG